MKLGFSLDNESLPTFVTQAASAAGCILLSACASSGPPTNGNLTVPEGFTVEIVAAAPLVERPMIVDMDEHGRLYVAESSGSNDRVQQQLIDKPHSILRLEDVDGDGKYDSRTVFADKMMLPEGVLWHDGSVYVGAPPQIWKLTDTDDDGVADQREVWFDGKTLNNCANDLHGPYLGPDGWIYWAKGAFEEQTYERPGRSPLVTKAAHIFRRRPEGGPIEPVLTGGMDNPIEVAFTPEGERFITSTFLQHPRLGRRDGILHAVYGAVYGKVHGVTDNHPMTGGYQSVMTHLGPAAPVGLLRYESTSFGEEYHSDLFATLFNMHKVTRHVLKRAGATFQTEDSDFLVSDSLDFHPTDAMEDADGSLLVVDTGGWYKICCPTSQLAKPDVLGAIYRVRRDGAKPVHDPHGLELVWNAASTADLVDRLDDSRPAVRRRAIHALSKHGAAAVEVLSSTLQTASSVESRRNAVWALTRITGDAARAAAREALSDADPSVRHAAVHSVSVRRDSEALGPLQSFLQSEDAPLQRVAAEALGRIGDSAAVTDLLAATALADDEVLTHSLTYALIEIADPAATQLGLGAESKKVRRAAVIALDQMEPSTLEYRTVVPLLSSTEPELSDTAEWIAGRHPEWGGALASYFRKSLKDVAAHDADGLARKLGRFVADPAIQDLLAKTASGPTSQQARVTALNVMAAASLNPVPAAWTDALVAALSSSDPNLQAAAVGAARGLSWPEEGVPSLNAALTQVARDASATAESRTKAIETSVTSLASVDAQLFDFLIASVQPSAPVAVRGAAARALSLAPLDGEQLGRLTASLREAGPMELPLLVEAFGHGDDAELGDRWVASLQEARGLANLRPDILEKAVEPYPESVQQKARALLAGLEVDLEGQRAKLEGLLANLEPGDIRRGQAVFNSTEAACSSCHAIGYEGGQVGPDLTKIGEIRDGRDLLEAVVFPSASFVRSFEPVVVDAAGESYNGVPLEESETHLLLATGADEQVRIAKAEIEEVRPGTVSVMPSGLEEQLSQRELSDLMAFLRATRRGPG